MKKVRLVIRHENINCNSCICSGNWGGRTGLEKVLLVIVGVLVVTAIVLSMSLQKNVYPVFILTYMRIKPLFTI